MMTLVLSNGFKGLLLSSYINIKYDLAVKSLNDLISKPSIDVILSHVLPSERDSKEFKLLRKRIFKNSLYIDISKAEVFLNDKDINDFRNGQTVIWCNTFTCPIYQILNPHLNLVYLNQHQFHSFQNLQIAKSHSHAKQINKL